MPDNSKTTQPNTPAANKRNVQNDVITIDFVQLFYELRRHIALLILTTVIGGSLGKLTQPLRCARAVVERA